MTLVLGNVFFFFEVDNSPRQSAVYCIAMCVSIILPDAAQDQLDGSNWSVSF